MKKGAMKRWVSVLGMALLLAASIALSVPPEVGAGAPCCSVTSVDKKTGVVKAKDADTGETFEIRLHDATQTGNIRTGDRVSTDFETRQVTIHSFQPVEGILIKKPMPPPPKK